MASAKGTGSQGPEETENHSGKNFEISLYSRREGAVRGRGKKSDLCHSELVLYQSSPPWCIVMSWAQWAVGMA